MVIAVIPIGNSVRLKNKHFLTLGNKRIIDIIVENLYQSNLFDEIVVYSMVNFDINYAKFVKDNEGKGPIDVLINSLKKFNTNIFFIGGDIPFFSMKSIKNMLLYPDNLSIIPKWENGYMEPLHALYSISALNYPRKDSFHEFIEQIPKVFIKAEKFPEYEFFNINTFKDYTIAKEIYQLLLNQNYEI
ncbi:MAG: NTP transferase domain-containing protein [Thermoplasmata archaeon]